MKSIRQSRHERALSKWSYNNQLDYSKQAEIAQVIMRNLIQFKATMTSSEDLISEIAKVIRDIHESTTYAQIIHHSVHCQQ